MTDHAAAAADRTLGHRPAHRCPQGFGDVFRFHMEAVDVVEQAVESLKHHRHVPVEAPVIRLLLPVQHNQRIAHHAQAVGVGEGDGTGQQAGLANPLQTCGVTVAVQHMDAGKARLLAGGTRSRFDNSDTG